MVRRADLALRLFSVADLSAYEARVSEPRPPPGERMVGRRHFSKEPFTRPVGEPASHPDPVLTLTSSQRPLAI